VDGTDVANLSVAHTIPFILTIDETMDVGADTRTAIDDKDYQPPFRFNGTITNVKFKLGPSQLQAADQKAAKDVQGKVND
jgi:hypothetical protein